MRGGTRALGFAATLLVTESGSANVELAAFVRALPVELDASDALRRAFGDSVSVIVTAPDSASLPADSVHVAPGLGVLDLSVERFAKLSNERSDLRFEWSAPLRLLLDRADGWARASSFRNQTGFTGRGTVIGIIDSGVDLSHPDLRTADGETRVRFWLDFSREAAGLQPELESDLGCDAGAPCAVFDADDIEALLANADAGDDLRDSVGHGTHVASLAAGNGLSSETPRFVGVAPEATLIVVRATRSNGAILDGDVLKAARFVFDRADELGMPAVVNLSLGSDFGGHDGSSALERGLAAMVGPEHPGHAVVVAAGNSAGMYLDVTNDLPGPFGIHTEVHVPNGAKALVPILTPGNDGEVQGVVYVWIATRAGDSLSVGVEDPDGSVLDPVAPGAADQTESGDAQITVINQTSEAPSPIPEGSSGAVVMLNGSWAAERLFGLTLEGPGSARIWVQGGGGLSPDVSLGPLLPRAQKEGTINVPATSPSVISVGATLNRNGWSDHTGESVTFREHGSLADAPDDTVAFFSSAGPNALGVLKPDIVAPGANVIGAMARDADPRDPRSNGIFSGLGRCTGFDDECFVVDDRYAVSSGTSMAAPIVAGAVALLFERDPALDQDAVRALLAAGARKLEGVVLLEQQAGAGALDLAGSLEALADGALERVPGSETRLVLASSFAHPDPSWPLEGLLEVRDDNGRVADGFDLERLRIDPHFAAFEVPPIRLAPGLVRFALNVPAGAGGKTLRLRVAFDGEALLARDVPVAVDHALSEQAPTARGGCSVTRRSEPFSPAAAFALLVAVVLGRVWRRRLAAQS
jgi:subtilisin family serine protease